jgi:hypothetical protein
MYDLIGKIVFIAGLLIAVLVPIMIIVQSSLNAHRTGKDYTMTVVYAVSAVVVWIILTFVIVMIIFMAVFGASGGGITSPAQEKRFTLIIVALTVIYALVGSGIIYLLRRRGRT